MINEVFGKLLVVSLLESRSHGQKVYKCLCECGRETNVLASNLKKGNSKSCGCSRTSNCGLRMSKLNFRHGETNTKLWRTWKGIVERTTCKTSSNYYRYGAKGIKIYDEWLNYKKFAEYIGHPPTEKHSIDRINNNDGYFPGNIRWATSKEQANNRKTNVFVLVKGKKITLNEAAKELNISKSTASRWHKSGKLQQYAL